MSSQTDNATTITGAQLRHLLRVTEALTHDATCQALDAYIEYPWAKAFGTERDRRRYRGLIPATPSAPAKPDGAYSQTGFWPRATIRSWSIRCSGSLTSTTPTPISM